jgi:hypothetical protein
MKCDFRISAAIAFAGITAWLTLSVPASVRAQVPTPDAKGNADVKGGGKGEGIGNLGMTPGQPRDVPQISLRRLQRRPDVLCLCIFEGIQDQGRSTDCKFAWPGCWSTRHDDEERD